MARVVSRPGELKQRPIFRPSLPPGITGFSSSSVRRESSLERIAGRRDALDRYGSAQRDLLVVGGLLPLDDFHPLARLRLVLG